MNNNLRIALTGNPNSGKTTLFNKLTGSSEQVGNWAGVTVAPVIARMKKRYTDLNIDVLDLPGTYSISPYTPEEAFARKAIIDQTYDVIINVADGANLSRSLFFASQLLEIGKPVVIGLNKADVLAQRGDEVDLDLLSRRLGVTIIPIQASRGLGLNDLVQAAIAASAQVTEAKEALSDEDRRSMIDQLIDQVMIRQHDPLTQTFSDRLDRIFIHPIIGLISFFFIMWGVYAFAIEGLGGWLSDWINETLFGEMAPAVVDRLVENYGLSPILGNFLDQALIGGVGAVLGFIPIIMLLFFLLSLLEDSGYMSRVAVLLDKYFKRIGLSGKSIIPMIVGSGCAVPGVMATRTIENVDQRRMTAMLTPFVPCSAKLPVIALISVAFFPQSSWVGPSTYVLAIVTIILGGLFLKKVFRNVDESHFIIELPEYRFPSLLQALERMWDQAKAFAYKAGTIIFVMSVLIWILQAFNFSGYTQDATSSFLAFISGRLNWLLIPLGMASWQLITAVLTGFVAKENVVSTLAVLLAAGNSEALSTGVLSNYFNPITAYSFLLLNLFTPPCVAAIAALKNELKEPKWIWRTLLFQVSVGYLLAMTVSQIGSLIVYGEPLPSWWIAAIVGIIYVVIILYLTRRRPKNA